MISTRCRASAADEEWYSPKRPSSTVAFQYSMQRHVSTIIDLYMYVRMYIHSYSRGSAYKHNTTSGRITSRSHITALPLLSEEPVRQFLHHLGTYYLCMVDMVGMCWRNLSSPHAREAHTHKQGMHFTPPPPPPPPTHTQRGAGHGWQFIGNEARGWEWQ